MVQCASPGRGGELVGVCGCVHDAGKAVLVGAEQLVGISSAPPLDAAYCLA